MELDRIHRKLLTDISDDMDVGSRLYGNFIEHMKTYVPRGLLDNENTLLGKFEVMERKGHLKPGDYEKLKDVCTNSGNINILDMIEEAERRIKKLQRGEDVGTGRTHQEDEVPTKKSKLDFTGLKNKLVKNYQEFYIKTEFNPLKPEEKEVDVDDIYTPLFMKRRIKNTGNEKTKQNAGARTKMAKSSKNKDEKKSSKQQERPISSIYELFQYNNKCYEKVLIRAKSGAGKTTLCRKLISLWCKQLKDTPAPGASASPDPADTLNEFIYVSDEDENTGDESSKPFTFDFLFYVSLRHAKEEEYIEDMIVKQLHIKEEDLQQILETTNCLVIVDGLDEWSPQKHTCYGPMDIKGCPKEKHVGRFYTLFTTRPWKLVDEARDAKKLELQCQLKGVHNFKEMIALNAQLVVDFSQEQFLEDVKNKKHLMSKPLLLKLVMLLWAENGELEESVCRLYGGVVELLIKSGIERNCNDCEFMTKVDSLCQCEELVPMCFKKSNDFSYLTTYFSAIKQVAKLSFETLRKGTSFMKDTDVKVYTEENDIDLVFLKKLGLFSRSPRIGGSFKDRESEVSFIHKSFLEFYAAIHIVSNPEECFSLLEAKRQKDQEGIISSDVFKYISGMDPRCTLKMYKLINMFLFNGEFGDEKGEILNGIVKKNINCSTCSDNFGSPFNILNGHIKANVREILSCGYKDITLPISYFCSCSCSASRGMLEMLKYLKYICPSTLERLILQFRAPLCFEHDEYPAIFILDYFPFSCYLWSGKCTNLREIKLKNIFLTSKQMENILLTHPSKLEIIILEQVVCFFHNKEIREYIERCIEELEELGLSEKLSSENLIKGKSLEEVGFADMKLSTSFCLLRELSLQDVDVLTHSQITHMLTDSLSLQTVSLVNVQCKKDKYCGCEKAVFDEENKVTSCSKISTVKTLEVKNSGDIFIHVKEYPRLENFHLENLKESLSTTQILGYLEHSVNLQSVFIKTKLESGEGTLIEYTGKPEGVSEVEACCTEENLKLLDTGHLNSYSRFNKLHEIILYDMEINHSQITYLLTLPHVEIVDLSKVVCQPDSNCGCSVQPGSSEELPVRRSKVKELTIHGGNEVFTHVSEMLNLKKLCFKGKIEKIDSIFFRVLRTSHCLEKIMFSKQEERIKDEEDYDYCMGAPNDDFLGEQCEISPDLLLQFIESVSKSHSSQVINLSLEKVSLIKGDTCDIVNKGDTGDIVNNGDTGDIVNKGDTGDIVNKGDTDDIANKGDTDDIANKGDAGDIVNKGDTGDIVNKGDTGDIVNKGDTGDIVNKGDTGDIVNKGDTGDIVNKGDTGDIANKGDTDDIANKGDTGDIVNKGDTGDIVNKGDTDDIVNKGDTGDIVNKGDTGDIVNKGGADDIMNTWSADYVFQTINKMENLQVKEFTKWEWQNGGIQEYEVEPGSFETDWYEIYPCYVTTSSDTNTVSMTILVKKSELDA